MKTIPTLLITALTLISSCSSPQEKHEERQLEAREDYNEDLKQSQEQFEEDELELQRDKAKDMIDESDSVEVNEDDGKIQIED